MIIAVDVRPLLAKEITGVGAYTRELLTALIAASDSTTWVLFSNSAKMSAPLFFDNPRVKICHTNYPNKLLNLLFYSKVLSTDSLVRRGLNTPKIDHWFSPNINFTHLSKETAHTLTIHDATFKTLPAWYTPKQQLWHSLTNVPKQVADAKFILTPSENTRRDCINFLNADSAKVHTLYSGPTKTVRDFVKATPEAKELLKRGVREKYLLTKPYILYLGALEPRKNLVAAVTAFETAASKLPEKYDLVLAGGHGWKNNELFKHLENSALAQQIRYLGYVSEEQKAALMAGASVFVYPSFYEGFGLPVLDSLALGVPVITSPRSALFEVAAEAAYFAHPERPAEIATGMIALITDKILRQKKIAAGLEQANKFSWADSAARLLNLWGGTV